MQVQQDDANYTTGENQSEIHRNDMGCIDDAAIAGKRRRTAKAMTRFLGFAVLVGIFCFIDFGKLYENLMNVRLVYLGLGILMLFPLFALKAGRWYLLMRTQGIPYTFGQTLLVWTSANFIAFITPGRLGEVAKAFYVRKDTSIPIAGTFPTVILDRLFDVYFLMAVATYGFFRFSLLARFQVVSWVIIGFILIFPWLMLKRGIAMTVIRLLLKLPGLKRLAPKITDMADLFFDEMKKLINARLIIAAFLTVGAYLFLFTATWFIATAADIQIDFVTISIFIAIANILSFVPISVSGVGTRDASLVFLFSLVGLSAEMAVLYSSLFFLVFFLVGGFIGYLCFLIKPIRIDSIKMPAAKSEN